MASAPHLLASLARMPPRSAEVVKAVTLLGLDRAGIAARYGITAEAADVLVLRSARDLVAAIRDTTAAPQSDDVERREAADLAKALADRSPHPLATPLFEIANDRDFVVEGLARAQAAAEQSPQHARELWIRRVLIAVLLALSAYFLWRDQTKPRPPPQPRPGSTVPVPK